MLTRFTLLVLFGLTASAAAQTKAAAKPEAPALGWRSFKFDNPGKVGEKQLNAIVHYPAKPGTKRARNAAILTRKTPFPVIVFLHGFGATGGMMVSLGEHFAERGYVCVLTNTTRTNRGKQAVNAGAFFAALTAANKAEDHLLAGKLDMTRAGISGHSMGGGNSLRVLGSGNPGFKCGFCFAPWTTKGMGEKDYVENYTKKLDVPLAIIHGTKDRVLPWKANAVRLFEKIKTDKAFKGLWVLDKAATHVNIAIPTLLQRKRDKTFLLCANLATCFFDCHLKGEPDAMKPYLNAKKLPKGIAKLQSNQ